MKSLTVFALLAFGTLTSVLTGIAAQAAEIPLRPMLNHFATCTGDIQGMPITLEFFEELDAKTSTNTGRGVVTQNIGGLMTLGGYTNVTKANGVRTVEMFAVIDPEVRFAKFDLKETAQAKLQIFAEGFGAVWGVFDCRAQVTPDSLVIR